MSNSFCTIFYCQFNIFVTPAFSRMNGKRDPGSTNVLKKSSIHCQRGGTFCTRHINPYYPISIQFSCGFQCFQMILIVTNKKA